MEQEERFWRGDLCQEAGRVDPGKTAGVFKIPSEQHQDIRKVRHCGEDQAVLPGQGLQGGEQIQQRCQVKEVKGRI